MRKASSYDLIRARSLESDGYSSAASRLSRPSSSALIAASVCPSGTPGRANGQGVGRVDLEDHARVLGAEIIGVGGSHALVFEGRAHRDELRQVVAERPETVVDPRADRRDSSRRANAGR